MSEGAATGRPTVQATERSFRIVEELMRRDGAGVTEIADAVGVSKSTAHEHLTTLDRLGYLDRRGDEYRVGLAFLTLGGFARAREELFRLGQREVDDLASETNESAKIVVEDHGQGLYIYQRRGVHAVRTDSHLGTRVYLHATAVGKAILSHLPTERVDAIIRQHGLPAKTDNTIVDREGLIDELEVIRDRGIAFDDQERMLGIRCVAAPIVRDGDLLGALSVSGPTKRIDDDRFRDTLPKLVEETARVIELSATYSRRP